MKKTWFKIGLLVMSMLAVALFIGCSTTDEIENVTAQSTNDIINEILAETGVSVPSDYTEYMRGISSSGESGVESIFLSPDNSEYIITVYQVYNGEITRDWDWDETTPEETRTFTDETVYKSVSRGTFTQAEIANVYLSDGTTKLTGYEDYLYKDTNNDIRYWQSISVGGFGTWKNYKIPASYTFMNNRGNTFEALMYGYLADDGSLTTWYVAQEYFDSHMTSGEYTKQ